MSHVNVFAKTSDTKTIIRFIKEIEKHPCLYDPKSPSYIDRNLKRKTWIYIAKKANSTVADCKEKWTKIRTAYIRTLRPSYNDGIRTFGRPYYLASHLKFISPMKRNGKTNCEYRVPQSAEKSETEINEEEEESDDSDEHLGSQDANSQHEVFLDEDNFDDSDEDVMGYNNIVIDKKDVTRERDTNEVNKPNVKELRNKSEQNSGGIGKRKSYTEDIECNPRKMFVFSLLPDIEDLNEQQMTYFRREVIKLIDKVMSD
ncbi:uncharacterized protein [Maniola hyperantus]|uniref:uncharacterized protein n=1 Tax=Aphantopus hyperantus TaxID=2795564 RepID=UPI0015690159|nr:uncharacterized protein LOC117993292 [Maniola hyperantus]